MRVRYLGDQVQRRVAIVTGTNGSLGALIEDALVVGGVRVAGCSRSTKPSIDIRKQGQVNRFVSHTYAKLGRIDVLVNSAGYTHPRLPLVTTPARGFLNSFETNVYGPFLTIRKVIPIMQDQGEGIIINIASKAGVYAVPTLGAYSASKAALVSLTQSAAKELRNTNILCVVVCPSGIDSPMRAALYGEEDAVKQQSPERVAGFVAEIVTKRSVGGMPVKQGDCVIVRKERVDIRAMEDG